MPSRRLRLLYLLAAVGVGIATLLLASPSQAVPARPGLVTLTQPNGDTFRARLFGDEFYNGYETKDGHTILEGERGRWRYAEKADDGSLQASSLVVGHDEPTMRSHLRDTSLVVRGDRLRDRRDDSAARDVRVGRSVGDPEQAPSIGADKSLVILAQFADQASMGTTPAQWSSAYFGAGKSVAGYYSAASGGQFTLSPAAETSGTANDGVVGWVTLGMNHPDSTAIGALNRQATTLAIQAADPYVNFASYDTNGDGVVRNTELHITVIAAGNEASYGVHTGKWLWGHKWSLFDAEIPTVDGKSVGGWGYTQFGEMHGDHMAAMGIMVHEIGHDLSLPDLYDTDQTSEGMGVWSVMSSGSWGYVAGTDTWQGQTPPLPDAWSRWYKGWITPHQVTGTEVRAINAAASGVTDVAVQMLSNPGGPHDWNWGVTTGTGEYFLVENRQQTGYDASLPGSGLLVLHVDESKAGNSTDTARLVDVEEADGLGQLDSKTNRGDSGDVYRGGGSTSFTDATNPNSKLNDGSVSNVSMTNVSASSASMSATFGIAPVTPTTPVNDAFADAQVASDVFDASVDTSSATTELGEPTTGGCSNVGKTVWYRYTATRDIRVVATTSGSNFDTVLNVWQGPSVDNLAARGCNDDTSGGLQSSVDFVAQSGQTFYIQAGGYSNAGATASGALVFHLRVEVVNDRFARASAILGPTGTTPGNNVGATRETGEPMIAGNGGGSSVWWRWVAPASGNVTFDTVGSGAGVDSLLGAYTGTVVNALTLVASNDDIDGANNRKSRVTFAAVAGTAYSLVVDTYNNGSPGDLALNWSLATPATAPDAPTGVSATAGYASADVSWTPGAANGSAITGYTVTASPGGATKDVAAGTTSTTVGGLTNGTSYTFTVKATNGIGTSPESAPSGAVTPAGAPDSPTGVTAVAGDTAATVSWTPGGTNGSAITGYTVTTFPGGTTKDVGAGATDTTVNGLTNGTPYSFTVKATNSVGTGPESSASTPVTPAGTPSAPTDVTATAGDSSASISWTAGSANGSALTGYTVTASPGGATKTIAGGTTSTSMGGLTNGTAYTFTVRATNAIGDSPESAASNEVTPNAAVEAPDAPTGVTATAGDASADVSWTPGSANGSPVTGYTVTASPGGATKTVAAGTTSTTINGLNNGTAYTFTVIATNAVGDSPASAASAPVTPAGTPSAPTGVSATAGDVSASVSWTPGSANGSPITGYTVTASPGGATKTVAGGTTSTTMGGLTNGTAYTFTVIATNAIGDSPESSPSNEVTPEVAPDPTDLAVSLSVLDHPGETTFAYRATVTRTHDADSSPVTVAIELPSTVELTEVPAGCVGGATLVCDLGQIASGDSQHVDATVRPLSPGPHAATASIDGTDADPVNDSDDNAASVDFVCDNAATAGDDEAVGTDGDDILCGLAGDDTIAGGVGDDLLFGGEGRDTLDYSTAVASMVVNLNFQDLTAETAWEKTDATADGTDMASGFENISGSAFNDKLLGSLTGADRVWGNAGKDTLYGYAGNDRLYGGAANDKLFGYEGKDLLVGGKGFDRLDGGAQRDTCREKSDKRISCEA